MPIFTHSPKCWRITCCLLLFSSVLASRAQIPGPNFPALLRASNSDQKSWPAVVAQNEIGDWACGPCAVFNAFRFGDAVLTNLARTTPGTNCAAQVKYLISAYALRASAIYHKHPRYSENSGVADGDIVPFINDWLRENRAGPLVQGEYLDLRTNETPRHQVQRVYGDFRKSLRAGFPPVASIQSYVARKKFIHYYWNSLTAHFVAVVAVQDPLPKDASGFTALLADSGSGQILQGYIYADQERPYIATKGFTVDRDDNENWKWIGDSPYLVIVAPGLDLDDGAKWHQRTVDALEYAAHR